VELESLHELYIDELKDLYSAEKQIVKALPRMGSSGNLAKGAEMSCQLGPFRRGGSCISPTTASPDARQTAQRRAIASPLVAELIF
jgi:hypothetical protein